MAIRYEDHCVCCDLPCINCGRKHVLVMECDNCKSNTEELYRGKNGDELCFECFLDEMDSKEGECETCGNDEDMVYFHDGIWQCRTCIEETEISMTDYE